MTNHALWIYKHPEGYEHFFMMAQVSMSFQLISVLLHILAHFFPKYIKPRDFVFANLAFPLSATTMVCFWTSWYLIGKSANTPTDPTTLYAISLIQGFHIVSPLINLILLYTIKHEYSNNPFMFSYCFMGVYLFAAFTSYMLTGTLRNALIQKFTTTETAVYYLAFSLFAHFSYICGFIYNDIHKSELDYKRVVAARLEEAEREINSAPSPISRTPTPLLILPRDSPSSRVNTVVEDRENSPDLVIPFAYRAKPAGGLSSSPLGQSDSRRLLGRRRADKKNN